MEGRGGEEEEEGGNKKNGFLDGNKVSSLQKSTFPLPALAPGDGTLSRLSLHEKGSSVWTSVWRMRSAGHRVEPRGNKD